MNNIELYIVKSGDTLYNIAKKHGITYQELMSINNLSNTLINIGKQLLVPSNKNNKINYYVEKNDTLYSIAQKFKINVEEIKELNNLNTNDVILGQLLKIRD